MSNIANMKHVSVLKILPFSSSPYYLMLLVSKTCARNRLAESNSSEKQKPHFASKKVTPDLLLEKRKVTHI